MIGRKRNRNITTECRECFWWAFVSRERIAFTFNHAACFTCELQIKLEQDRLKKLASKSHRDRINEFNTYLSNLSVCVLSPQLGFVSSVWRFTKPRAVVGACAVLVYLFVLPKVISEVDCYCLDMHHQCQVPTSQEHHDIPRVGPG
jgi:hypothetical protein